MPALNSGNLIWTAVGPLGYVVLGPGIDDGWYSPDLQDWYVIPVEGSPTLPTYRGWVGPCNVTITDEKIVIPAIGCGDPGAWIGTPP